MWVKQSLLRLRTLKRELNLNSGLVSTCALALALFLSPAFSQTGGGQPSASNPIQRSSEALPVDRRIVQGYFPNGMRYLIRRTDTVGADIRLVANVGSLDEEDDELGFAHFVEHMAFRKTARFADGEIIDFVRSLGGSFGQHLNAFTAYDRTQYWLSLPAGRTDALPTALRIVADWANGIEFPESLSEIERGVVVSEKRARDQSTEPSSKIRKTLNDQAFYRREIVGTDETLKASSGARLSAFYKKHYTPDRLTIVLTGQLVEGEGFWERKLKDEFGALGMGAQAVTPVKPRRPPFVLENRVRVLQLNDAPNHSFAIAVLSPQTIPSTKSELRYFMARSLASIILTQRLRAASKAQPWMIDMAAVDSALSDSTRIFQLVAVPNGREHYEASLSLLRDVVQKFLLNGPTDEELNAAKEPLVNSARVAEEESVRASPSALGSQIAAFAHSGGYLLASARYRELLEELLPTISSKDLVNQIADRFNTQDTLLMVQSPRGEPAPTLDEAKLIVNAKDFAAQILKTAGDTLASATVTTQASVRVVLPEPNPPGRISNEESLTDGITRLTLSNGAVVYVKATSTSVDQVLFSMRQRGGLWSLSPEQLPAARLVQSGALLSDGIGPLDGPALTRESGIRGIGWRADVSDTETTISLRASSSQLAYGLHLIHLWMRDTKVTEAGVKRIVAQSGRQIAELNPTPPQRFAREWLTARRAASPWFDPTPLATQNAVTVAQIEKLHAQLLGDASKMVFAFTGNVSLRDIRRLTEIYVASLPSSGSTAQQRTPVNWAQLPEEKLGVRAETRAGDAQRSVLRLRYVNPKIAYDLNAAMVAAQIQAVLSDRMRRALRSDSGLTYSPSSGASVLPPPLSGATVQVEAQLALADLATAETVMRQTVQSLIDQAPSAAEVQVFREQFKANTQGQLNDANSAGELLKALHLRGQTLAGLRAAQAAALNHDAAQMHDAIKLWLQGVEPSVGILRPRLSSGPAPRPTPPQ
jgi:zinc protease